MHVMLKSEKGDEKWAEFITAPPRGAWIGFSDACKVAFAWTIDKCLFFPSDLNQFLWRWPKKVESNPAAPRPSPQINGGAEVGSWNEKLPWKWWKIDLRDQPVATNTDYVDKWRLNCSILDTTIYSIIKALISIITISINQSANQSINYQ